MMNDGVDPIDAVHKIAEACGGKVEEIGLLPDDSGFATMSFPLPKTHWLYQLHDNIPPMPFRLGTNEFFVFGTHKKLPPEGGEARGTLTTLSRDQFSKAIRAAGKYAIRCSTMNGSEEDFDPDAMLQNLVVGMLGYWSPDGWSNEAMFNPTEAYDFDPDEP